MRGVFTMHGLDSTRLGAIFAMAATAVVAGSAAADYIGCSPGYTESGGLAKYDLFANFNGATDTVLNAFHISRISGATAYHHADALTGGVITPCAGTWNPQFVLVPGAMDSYVCIGGGEGFASGNSTAADPDWGAAGFNTAQIPYGNGDTSGPGWFNQNPPNLQGRVNAQGQVKLGQFVVPPDSVITIRLKLGYNNGQGGGVQFGDLAFTLGFGSGMTDCDDNGVVDVFEIQCSPELDCDLTGTLDVCEFVDCDSNGVHDPCEFVDCDGNGTLDACDIGSGFDSDTNGNGVPDACEFPWGDLNRDGIVTAGDFSMLLTAWGTTKPNLADLNRDGVVDGADMTILLDNWGATN
jgi:hypothetical protein